MNIDNKRRSAKGFFNRVAPYATAASGAAIGLLVGGLGGGVAAGPLAVPGAFIGAIPGAIAGAQLGYELGEKGPTEFFNSRVNADDVGMAADGVVKGDFTKASDILTALSNKRKRQ